jgi:hypothetical protein
MLLMADLRAIECRSPAVPPTVCDLGSEELGMVGGAGVGSEGELLLCSADDCDGEEDVDGSAVWARAWDAAAAGAGRGACGCCCCCCFGPDLLSLSR